MHHDLLKKYQDEVNMSVVKQGLINQLKIELDQCHEANASLESELHDLRGQSEQLEQLKRQNKSLQIDVEEMKLKYDEYKKELDFFDDDFFDEIKRLKSKYNDALKLNKYYENLLFFSDKNTCKLDRKPRVKFAKDQCFDKNELGQFSDLILEELEDI